MHARMTTAQERKAQERQVRRRRIQQAAREVFAARGYAGASIEQIARHAQLSVGAIYLYFRSKEDLYVSLLEETLAVFDADLTRMRGRVEVKDRLEAAWTLLLEWIERDPEGPRIVRLMAQPGVGAQLSDEVRTAIGAGWGRMREHLGACVADGIHAGIYRAVNAGELADLAWSLLLGTLDSRETRVNLGLEVEPLDIGARRAFALVASALGAPADALAVQVAA
jgi:AcrR family transcriptional regulator